MAREKIGTARKQAHHKVFPARAKDRALLKALCSAWGVEIPIHWR